MWALVYKANFGEKRAGDIIVITRERPLLFNTELAELIPIPDQDISAVVSYDENGLPIFIGNIRDLAQYSAEEKAKLIDAETGQAINLAIHAFAPIEEQIGILREQIVHILNTLGLEPTPEFQRLHETAIAEIEKGRMKKEALYAENNQA